MRPATADVAFGAVIVRCLVPDPISLQANVVVLAATTPYSSRTCCSIDIVVLQCKPASSTASLLQPNWWLMSVFCNAFVHIATSPVSTDAWRRQSCTETDAKATYAWACAGDTVCATSLGTMAVVAVDDTVVVSVVTTVLLMLLVPDVDPVEL